MTVDTKLARSSDDDESRGAGQPFRSPEPLPVEPGVPERSKAWRYYICVLLLLATTINYLDRMALSSMSVEITGELGLSDFQYGTVESGFSIAFACGALAFGWLADRTNVRWLYPAALLLWSMVGYCTGFVETFVGLLVCRTLLGLFEAGHWPCALRTTQRLLPTSQRTLGNSILQSGSSIGAALTPLLVKWLLEKNPETGEALPGAWRFVFRAIGLIGMIWVAFWLLSTRSRDLRPVPAKVSDRDGSMPETANDPTFFEIVFTRRFGTLLLVVMPINACWHLFRYWMPKFLQQGRGYSQDDQLNFTFWFYIITDVGCILAGILTMWLTRQGASVHRARVVVFTGGALLTSLSVAIPFLPAGWPLLAVLMTVGFGCLALFPCYYSFSQELTVKHQGKITGLLGAFAWISVAPLHPLFGKYIDKTKSFDAGLVAAGLFPLIAVAALWVLWSPAREESRSS